MVVHGVVVDETFTRLLGQKGVEGVVIVNMDGISIKSTLNPEKTAQYSTLITRLVKSAQSMIKELDPSVLKVNVRMI